MELECGLRKNQDQYKPLLLNIVNKVRVGDFAPASAQNNSPGSEDLSGSPNHMKPHFNNQNNHDGNFVDQTPPATGIQGSGDAENSRKNTRNTKQKHSK